MGVPDIQQAAKATDNFGLLKSSLEQCDEKQFLCLTKGQLCNHCYNINKDPYIMTCMQSA